MPDEPFPFTWSGTAMLPPLALAQRAAERFTEGKRYLLVEHKLRSRKSHDHQFAALHEAWLNLPEALAPIFPTEEHLRKFALIKTGYADLKITVMDTERDAQRLAVALRRHEFELVTVTGTAVYRYSAKSQSQEAMGAETFQQSKQAVLDYVAALVNVDPLTLRAEAGMSA